MLRVTYLGSLGTCQLGVDVVFWTQTGPARDKVPSPGVLENS